MGRAEFGQLVRTLREQRTFFNQNQRERPWTQAELARQAKLTRKEIARVEQGKVINLQRYLEPLAKALALSQTDKNEFYALAGYVYQDRLNIGWAEAADRIKSLFERLEYPASARTRLWDFVAFNSSHYSLWGYTPEKMDILNNEKDLLGPNLLRIIFDARFEHHKYKSLTPSEGWGHDFEQVLQTFRSSSLPYINTQRYRQIITGMQNYRSFTRSWALTQPLPEQNENPSISPIITVTHPKFQKIEFLSLRVPFKYLGCDLDISIYVPLSSSWNEYKLLRKSFKENQVYRFKLRSLD